MEFFNLFSLLQKKSFSWLSPVGLLDRREWLSLSVFFTTGQLFYLFTQKNVLLEIFTMLINLLVYIVEIPPLN